jgi:hypothetical protein
VIYIRLTKLFSTSAFDIGSNKIWDSWNQGVCHLFLISLSRYTDAPGPLQYPVEPTLTLISSQRQWKDIKQRYMVKEEEDDE